MAFIIQRIVEGVAEPLGYRSKILLSREDAEAEAARLQDKWRGNSYAVFQQVSETELVQQVVSRPVQSSKLREVS